MTARQSYLALLIAFGLVSGFDVPVGCAAQRPKAYIAKLIPLNANTTHSHARGRLRLTISRGVLTIELNAWGLPPGMMHMIHLHGFPNGKAASCPTAAADTNHDGIIDVTEIKAAAGITLVPLDRDPAALDIAGGAYPVASESGHVAYRQSVSLAHLDREMAARFRGASLDLDKRVVFIHSILGEHLLPETVASMADFPAQATIPIACGKIVPAR